MMISNGPLDPPQAPITLRPPRPGRLVFAGEALVDVLMRVPGLPPRGGDILATSSEVAVGGGFNVMAAAAKAAAKQALADAEEAARQAAAEREAAELEAKRGERKERKALTKAEAKAARDARYAARKARR